MALPRDAADARAPFERAGRVGVIVPHPAVEQRADAVVDRPDRAMHADFAVLESHLRDEARLEGVRLAAREIAHLLNNDLAVAVGLVDLLKEHPALPPDLADLLRGAESSLDAAARHIAELQRVVRVVVKETPAGQSLDLERSRASGQASAFSHQPGFGGPLPAR